MGSPFRVYVFGDQTYDIADVLSSLLHTYHNPILVDFFERSCRTIKDEVASLSPDLRKDCPSFSKLIQLLPSLRAGSLNPAISQALTALCQLALFIKGHSDGSHPFPSSGNACLIGRCTGTLTAATVACANNPSELLILGLHTVRIAFRVGAAAWATASALSTAQDPYSPDPTIAWSSWTVALSGVSEEQVIDVIDQFTKEKTLAKTSSPYISARIAPSALSISAPPDVLDTLLNETQLRQHVASRLSITAPYHAGHLYCSDDVAQILSCLDQSSADAQSPLTKVEVISSVSGRTKSCRTFYESIKSAVEDCLLHSIGWKYAPQGIADCIRSSSTNDGAFSVQSLAISSDGLRPAVQKLLRKSGVPTMTPLEDTTDAASSSPAEVPRSRSKIAIVGMSGRFPRARSMNAFWNILENGVDTHEIVPPTRWSSRTHVNTVASPDKNVSGTGFGCWLHDAADFDARFFNMSPREAPQVDPAQRMALLTAAEALEQAGIVPGRTSSTSKDRVGVYFGATSNDWMETNSAQNIDTYFIPGGNRAFIPGRINYHFKFSGPSYTIDTACSSSLAAVHLACNALWRNEVDTAIVGGTNVLTNPDMTAGLDRGHFLSRTGNCKTFDETADGYCRGEAVATVILKRLDDAIAEKDPIQACILAIATNHSAEADSITRPHVGAQQTLFENVLAEAGVKAGDISYCELHGTGTQAGDAGETASVLQTLASDDAKFRRKPDQPLYIGAAKSNVGHGEAAAGVTSLAKVLMMLKKSTIPPHCGIKTKINTRIPDLSVRNTFIAKSAVPWQRPKGGLRQVLLNNFSAAGGNTALVLEDAPLDSSSEADDPRSNHVVAVSAKTAKSLENNIRNLRNWMAEPGDPNLTLARLSYTTTARRVHHAHRVMATGSNLAEISESLNRSLDQGDGITRPKGSPGFVFAFTGQGCQFNGMGSDLYARLRCFRADIVRYDRICTQLGLPSIKTMFDGSTSYDQESPTMLQLSAVCLQMALYRMWLSFGIRPKAVVGHSLGEYAALYAAGVLSQSDVLNLVGHRAKLMEQHCKEGSHAMLAVRSNAEDLSSFLGPPGDSYEISCFNGTKSIVLGGTKDQMSSTRPSLKKRGLSATFLEVPYAYHTSQVDPILSSLSALSAGIKFGKPQIPVISPTLGRVAHESSDFGVDYVVQHCRASVKMVDALKLARQEGVIEERMIGIEIGPLPVVVKMVKEIAGPAFQTFASIRHDEDTWKLLTKALSASYVAGADINWTNYHADFESSQKCIELPAYSWDMKEYWMQYVNDWSLRKGDPPLRALPVKLESSSIHKIIDDTISSGGGELLVEADLTRKDLHPMVQGHKVYGVPLCTPSVYADIALSIGGHIKQVVDPSDASLGVDVSAMTIQSALVANATGQLQLLQTKAIFDAQTKTALCKFSSVNSTGKVIEQHAHCTLRLFDIDAAREARQATAPAIRARMDAIKAQASSIGNTFRFSKAMIYKMVGQLADFDPNYRGLVEITLDNDQMEATGRVSFAGVLNEGSFHTNPAFIDALSQLGGFVMNGNEGVDLDAELFVNHGWGSLQLYERIDPAVEYTSHVKMSEGKDKLWSGDVSIFAGDKLVAVFGGVALQGVPKRLMQYIVNTANKRVSGPSTKMATTAAPISAASVAKPAVAKVTKTVKQSTVSAPPAESTLVKDALKIVSEESGIAQAELTDDSRFNDIGVDSLLSLMVSSRFKDELSLDFESSLFHDLGSVGKLKTHIGALAGPTQVATATETVVEEMLPVEADAPIVEDGNVTWDGAFKILVEESGLAEADLTNDASFADIGIDSLLSLVICSRLRDEHDLDISDRSLFLDYPTVGSLKKRIVGSPAVEPDSASSSSDSGRSSATSSASNSPKDGRGTPDTEPPEESKDSFVGRGPIRRDSALGTIQEDPPVKPAWSIILQGSPKKAKEKLFLFPDGCGAATSYLKLPQVSPSTAVIGFNSPYMKNPHDMLGRSLDEVLSSYVEALRRHQPHGPYHLGGWSAGGILAYAIMQELMASGEEVANLLLIDSPAPTRGLDRLPRRFFDHCSKVGIFGTEMMGDTKGSVEPPKVPAWLMPHFEATIELLHDYRAPPMPEPGAITTPQVHIIWAGECAFDGVKYPPFPAPTEAESVEDTEGMKFLTEKRVDLGPGEWALLFPGREIKVDIAQGEHHFSMMRANGGEQLVEFVRKALRVH